MRAIFLFALLAMGISLSAQQTFFVKVNATGDGSSWDNASGDLKSTLAKANYGDQIWVARGTYLVTNFNDRNATFSVKDGVQLYGGFEGFEVNLEDRNVEQNRTVLSGEIGQQGTADNAYSVVTTTNVSEATIIDGLVITGGNANESSDTGNPRRCGGGLFNDGSNGGSSTPTIVNCTFTRNVARDGGAIYNKGIAGNASPIISNCKFRFNSADLDGGAIYNDGKNGGKSSPVVIDSYFEENMASYGAAIFIGDGNGNCNLLVENCTFNKNAAYLWGGAVYSLTANVDCSMELSLCTFVDNYPTDINKSYSMTQNNAAGNVLLVSGAE